jgi:hypothetical protein
VCSKTGLVHENSIFPGQICTESSSSKNSLPQGRIIRRRARRDTKSGRLLVQQIQSKVQDAEAIFREACIKPPSGEKCRHYAEFMVRFWLFCLDSETSAQEEQSRTRKKYDSLKQKFRQFVTAVLYQMRNGYELHVRVSDEAYAKILEFLPEDMVPATKTKFEKNYTIRFLDRDEKLNSLLIAPNRLSSTSGFLSKTFVSKGQLLSRPTSAKMAYLTLDTLEKIEDAEYPIEYFDKFRDRFDRLTKQVAEYKIGYKSI